MSSGDNIRRLAVRLLAAHSGETADAINRSFDHDPDRVKARWMNVAREALHLGARAPEELLVLGGPRHGERMDVTSAGELRLPITPPPLTSRPYGTPAYSPIRHHLYRVREVMFEAGRPATRVLVYEGER